MQSRRREPNYGAKTPVKTAPPSPKVPVKFNRLWSSMATAANPTLIQRQVGGVTSAWTGPGVGASTELQYSDPYRDYYQAAVLGPYALNLLPPVTLAELKEIARILPKAEIKALKKKAGGRFIGFVGEEEEVETLIPHLNAALQEFHIDTPERKAVYIAHMLRETSNLTRLEERPEPEDSARYKANRDLRDEGGIGAFHHTDKSELRKTARNLEFKDENILINTDLGAEPTVAFRMGGEYFTRHGFHSVADRLSGAEENKREALFKKTTNKINPGEAAATKKKRFKIYEKALAVLGREPNHTIRLLQRTKPPYRQVALQWPGLVDRYFGEPGVLYGRQDLAGESAEIPAIKAGGPLPPMTPGPF